MYAAKEACMSPKNDPPRNPRTAKEGEHREQQGKPSQKVPKEAGGRQKAPERQGRSEPNDQPRKPQGQDRGRDRMTE